MLDSLLLYLNLALSKALDASNRVVNKVIDQVLIDDFFLVYDMRCKSYDYLRMINETSLHNLRKLRDQVLFFK